MRRCIVNRPSCPSLEGGSLTHSQALALSKRARDVTAPPRRSEPLRSKVGGASKPSPCCAGWDRQAVAGGDLMLHQSPRHVVRDGTAWGIAVYSLQLIVYSLQLILWLFADNLQISCDSLGGFEEKA